MLCWNFGQLGILALENGNFGLVLRAAVEVGDHEADEELAWFGREKRVVGFATDDTVIHGPQRCRSGIGVADYGYQGQCLVGKNTETG